MPSGWENLGALGEAIGKAIAHLQHTQEAKNEFKTAPEAIITQKPMDEGHRWDRESEHHSQTGYYPISPRDERPRGDAFGPRMEADDEEDFQRSLADYRDKQAQAEAQMASEANAQRERQLNAKYDLVQSMGPDEQRKAMSPQDWQRIQIERQRNQQR